jgi:hypothetical protein
LHDHACAPDDDACSADDSGAHDDARTHDDGRAAPAADDDDRLGTVGPGSAQPIAGQATRRDRPRLCVAVVTRGDHDDARLTIQAIRLYHREVADRISFLIVDEHTEGWAAARDRCLREAGADVVCCIDSGTLLEPGSLEAVIAVFDGQPDSRGIELRGDGLLARRPDAAADRQIVRHPAVAALKRPHADTFRCFDGIFCLNLDAATERWREATRRHARLGIAPRVERFPGVPTPDNRHAGIALSFRLMIDEASRRDWEHVLVLEDDAVFLEDGASIMRDVAAELAGHEWDLCYLGACVWSQQFPALGESTVLALCGPVTCTHAVAFHRRAYDRLLADLPPGEPELARFLRQDVAIDQYLSHRIADGTFRAVITSPRVASQPNLLQLPDADGALGARYVI